jgi:hypothetical protein
MATFAYTRIHNELYMVYYDGKQIGEIDRDHGEYWQITFRGDRIENVFIQDLRQAKTFIENMVKRGWANDDTQAADGVA